MNNRLLYPDIIKFLAIFLVTWSHCAQVVSGQTWTNFMGGIELDLAINMPLFMIISGWFLNLDKIRKSKAIDYALQKFKRLIVPSVVWYFIHLFLSFKFPGLSIFSYYWYLNGLFLCLCIIMLASKIIRNDIVCIIITLLLILLCPYTNFCHINFMLPFLWAGYGLRKVFESKNCVIFVLISFIIGIVIFPYWNHDFTVYKAPFNSIKFNDYMLIAFLYRFIIGFCLSVPIIYLAYMFEKCFAGIASYVADLGRYSLVIYTSSLAILGFVKRCLNLFDLHTNQYAIIDILSLLMCLAIIAITIMYSNLCRKNRTLKLMFLGEFK